MSNVIKKEMPEIVKELTDYLLECCKEEVATLQSQTEKEGFDWTPETTINFYLSAGTIFAGSLLNLVIMNFAENGSTRHDLLRIIDSFNTKMNHLTQAILSTEAFKRSVMEAIDENKVENLEDRLH